ncbi:hypothetical protein D3C76_993160 [compost metagenome]
MTIGSGSRFSIKPNSDIFRDISKKGYHIFGVSGTPIVAIAVVIASRTMSEVVMTAAKAYFPPLRGVIIKEESMRYSTE